MSNAGLRSSISRRSWIILDIWSTRSDRFLSIIRSSSTIEHSSSASIGSRALIGRWLDSAGSSMMVISSLSSLELLLCLDTTVGTLDFPEELGWFSVFSVELFKILAFSVEILDFSVGLIELLVFSVGSFDFSIISVDVLPVSVFSVSFLELLCHFVGLFKFSLFSVRFLGFVKFFGEIFWGEVVGSSGLFGCSARFEVTWHCGTLGGFCTIRLITQSFSITLNLFSDTLLGDSRDLAMLLEEGKRFKWMSDTLLCLSNEFWLLREETSVTGFWSFCWTDFTEICGFENVTGP